LTLKILCLWHATDDEITYIQDAMPDGTEVVCPKGDYFSRFECTYSDVERHAVDADAFIGWVIPKGILEIASRLKLLCWLHSGCHDLDLQFLKQRGVTVANTRGANATAVAEQAMMFMLALAKKTIFKHQILQEGHRLFPHWADDNRSAVLSARTIGVIGVGSIGSRIAKHAKGFDMRVLGVRRKTEEPVAYVDAMYGMTELHTVLGTSDYVAIATPNTSDTLNFFGEAEFAAMKPSAFLINIASGNLVQERPLYEALTSGRLRGYAADAWQRYEFGRTFPIGYMPRLEVHKLPNVIGSLAEASNADDVLKRHLQSGTQSLGEFSAGRPVTQRIDLDLGY
jgi:phosphoglycerate dehydrogenase-like enzyme